jgi:hypothetical protein
MKHRGPKDNFGFNDNFGKMRLNLARHNLEVTLKRTKEQCFRAAKECGSESLEGFKKMDAFVRNQYYDEPKKMAEWDEIARKYEFMDEDEEVAEDEEGVEKQG